MNKLRDLQKLVELAQMDFSIKRSNTLHKYKRSFIERFAKENQADEADGVSLEKLQAHIKDIPVALLKWKNGADWFNFDFENKRTVVGWYKDTLHIVEYWEDYIRRIFIECLDGLPKEKLLTCPQCGKLYVRVGKAKKQYCSNRCGVEANRG